MILGLTANEERLVTDRTYKHGRHGYKKGCRGGKTDPTKAAPHPNSPTIDHVIPLAQGGTHEPPNCRTACFQCNSHKGDRGGGEQMLLVAIP